MPYGHDWAVSDVTGGGCILMADFLIVLILSGIAIAGAAITLRYRSVMRAVRERIESLGSRVVRTDCGPIEYARAGSGYPVLVVHGNAGGFDQGLMLADRSIGPEFQVIAVSRFGYLGSPMPPKASVAIQADAFASLLDSLAIKQAASRRRLLGRVRLVDPVCPAPPGACLVSHPCRARRTGKGPGHAEAYIHRLLPERLHLLGNDYLFSAGRAGGMGRCSRGKKTHPRGKGRSQVAVREPPPRQRPGRRKFFEIYVSTPGLLADKGNEYPFGRIRVPTLVVSAVDDPLALHENARALAERIPGARLQTLPGGGHMLLGQYGTVKQGIAEFLHNNVASLQQPRESAGREGHN